MKSDGIHTVAGVSVQNLLLDSISQMIIILDDANTIKWHNRRVLNFFGKTINGESFSNIFFIDPDELERGNFKALSTVPDRKNTDRILEHAIIKSPKKNRSQGRIVIIDDVTEKIKHSKLVGFFLDFENLLTRLALESINIRANDIDSHINKLLMIIGKFANVERCFLAMLSPSDDEISITHDWSAPGFTPSITSFSTSYLPPRWKKRKREVFIIPDVEKVDYPPGVNHEMIFSPGIKSVRVMPLVIKNRCLGFLGFSSMRYIGSLSPELKSIFKITAELTLNLLERKLAYNQVSIAEKIVSKSSGMLAYIDSRGFIKTTNEAFRKFFGVKESNPQNLKICSVMNNRLGSRESRFIEHIKRSLNGEEVNTEIWFQSGEKLRLLEISLHPTLDNDDKTINVIFNSNDITDRVQLEARILEVIHKERKKIGISLHDDLGHDLLAVAIKSRLLADRLRSVSEEMSTEVYDIETALKNAMTEVRRLSHGLIPYKNHGLEFREMIDAIALTIERDYSLNCDFHVDETININDESIIKEIYYIIDEAVVNSIKHSGCSKIRIEMVPQDRMIELKIIDNGTGLLYNSAEESGVGLEIMKYRARAIGGFLEVKNHHEGGAMVRCVFNPEKIML